MIHYVSYISIKLLKKIEARLDMMAHACNPSYLGDGDGDDHGSRSLLEKC
jgi:hypothetical protein